ncbi:MAG: beta-lactamase family protein [Clostridiales bacterium]|nr:beta-lactamase family protein [Clostridiales bacterium]
MNINAILQTTKLLTQEYGIPAWGLTIYQDQKEVCQYVCGYRDYAKQEPATPEDLCWLFSLTKIATCTAAMQLIERGKLGLFDNVSDYLPAFKNQQVLDHGVLRPAASEMKVIDLMTMRGGLDYNLDGLCGDKGSSATNSDIFEQIAKRPLNFDPGTCYQYSLCHDVLAGVIAAAAGIPYAKWLEQEVFAPLGMTQTRFATSKDELKPFSDQYIYENEIIVPYDVPNCYVMTPQYCSGGAGLASSLSDYVLLINALANLGVGANGQRILSEPSILDMATNRLNDEQLKDFSAWRFGYGYGLGVRTRLDNEDNPNQICEFGWDGAAGSYAICDLTNRIGVLYTQHVRNCGPAYDVIHIAIRDAVLAAL